MDSFRPVPKLRPLLIDPSEPLIHRDLSWLQFNARVLDEADLKNIPLLERAKFLSISASNLDEFFMIRMATLGKAISDAMRAQDLVLLERLRRIRAVILAKVGNHLKRQAQILDRLSAELAPTGIHIVLNPTQNAQSTTLAREVFLTRVLPHLPFPIKIQSATVTRAENSQILAFFPSSGLAVPVPLDLKPVFSIESSGSNATPKLTFFFLDRLIEAFLGPALGRKSHPVLVRITRDGDFSADFEEEDAASIPDVVLSYLRKRGRGRPVRIQYRGVPNSTLFSFFNKTWKLSNQQIFAMPRTMCLHGLLSATSNIPAHLKETPGLTYPASKPPVPKILQKTDFFEVLRKRDILLHHPYDSFDAYINWIKAACLDPNTTLIQQTVYRVDVLSPVIGALKAAAKNKKVRVLVELRARFDESNNLKLSQELRDAGVEVVYGFGNLKLHAKLAVVVRQEGDGNRIYTHLSTGNYNSITAAQYTDLAILTSHREIGEEALYFMETVSKGEVPLAFKRLVPAPTQLHRKIAQLIDAEIASARAGKAARIISKVNTLVDKGIIEKLYKASNEGVQVDLIVRGACALVPGVKGLSENIRIFSIVDRFLEHSRIYYFQNSNALYLSSADWMPRNFFSRLELAFPVLDERIYRYISQILLPTYLNDRAKAKELTSDGSWKERDSQQEKVPIRSQFYFQQLAENHYQGTPLEH